MKKTLSRAVLVTGVLTLWASAANAAIIRFSQEVTFSLDSNNPAPPPNQIQLPQYNAADFGGFPLQSITLLAEGTTVGNFTIINQGGAITFNDLGVGARTPISVPSGSPTTILLTPIPVTNFTGVNVPSGSGLSLPLDGEDTQQRAVDAGDFSIYEGTGLVTFPINSFLVVRTDADFITPINNTQFINLTATTRLTVIYENTDPLEIPERGFNFLSLVLGGLAGLALKARGRSA